MWTCNLKFSEQNFSFTSKNNNAYSRNLGHGCVLLCIFFEKKNILVVAFPKEILFLTIFNKHIFSKLTALDWVR